MIAEDDVRYVAKLARLRLEPDEAARMTGELAKILAHIDKMSELDLADVPPTAHVLDVVNVTRADKERPEPVARRSPAQRPGRERRLLPRAEDGLTVTALDPLRLTARDAKRLLVDGEISSAELAKVYLDQIAAVEAQVRAYILRDRRQRRQVLHQGRPRDAGACAARSPACPSPSRTTWSPRASPPRAPRGSSHNYSRSTRPRPCARCGTTTW